MSDRALVYVIDDDAQVRTSLQVILEANNCRVSLHSNAEDFLTTYTAQPGCCVITDLNMPGMTGVELQRALAGLDKEVAVIAISGVADVPTTVQLMERGAVTVLEKPYSPADLIAAVRKGCARTAERRKERRELTEIQKRMDSLTEEEREVLAEIVRGKTSKVIGMSLHISSRTLDRRRHSILEKMQVSSVAELASIVERLNQVRTGTA